MFWTCGGVGPPRAVAPVSARGTCVRQGEMYDVRIVGAFLADLKREDGVLLFSHPVCGRGGEFVHVDPSEPSPGCETFFRVGATRSRVGGGVAGENAFIRICAVKISGGKRRGGVGRIVGADVEFVTCGEEDEHGRGNDDEEYGYDECRPYLKFGFYFFLSHKVDGQLYAQTSAAPDSVELLLNRVAKGCHGHNEKDFFPLTGVSYVVIEVRRGFRGSVQPEREDAGGVHAERVRELLYGQQAEGGD